eukprot:m.67612 g.67612  ORF g.67612 m.67612 type:complete len:584 (+) comp13839_c0_seq1:131-1882(+)
MNLGVVALVFVVAPMACCARQRVGAGPRSHSRKKAAAGAEAVQQVHLGLADNGAALVVSFVAPSSLQSPEVVFDADDDDVAGRKGNGQQQGPWQLDEQEGLGARAQQQDGLSQHAAGDVKHQQAMQRARREGAAHALARTQVVAPAVRKDVGRRITPRLAAWEAVVYGLQPGRPYKYVVRDAQQPAGPTSRVFYARQPPRGAANATIAVVGDIGTLWTSPWLRLALLQDQEVDALVIVGDAAYTTTTAQHAAWLRLWEPVLSRIPTICAIGNEDNVDDFVAHLASPHLVSTSGSNSAFWFGVDIAGVHFTVLSSEHDFSTDSPQAQWAEQDLLAADAQRRHHTGGAPLVPFLVALHHRSGWTSYQSQFRDDKQLHGAFLELRSAFEDMFVSAHVDLVFAGHDHVYERTKPVRDEEPDAAQGVINIQVGTGGHNVRATWDSPEEAPDTTDFRQGYVTGFAKLSVVSFHGQEPLLYHELVAVETGTCAPNNKGCSKQQAAKAERSRRTIKTRVIDSLEVSPPWRKPTARLLALEANTSSVFARGWHWVLLVGILAAVYVSTTAMARPASSRRKPTSPLGKRGGFP